MTKETFMVVVKFAVVVSAALVFFYQDLALVFGDGLQNEAASYVLVIPFLVAYLIFRKRKMIRAAIPLQPSKFFKGSADQVIGCLLFLTSFLLYWFGSYSFTPLEYHMIALPIFLTACILVLFNYQTVRQMVFPIAFLLLLVPPPGEILHYVGAQLQSFSAMLAYNLLAAVHFPVSLELSLEGMPMINVTSQSGNPIQLYVDVACSGIYSQIGFFVFAVFIAYIIRDKSWKKALMFSLGFPLIYMLNVLRIAVIGIIGYYYGQDMVLTLFHLLGGWVLIFLGTFLLLIVSEKLLKIRILAEPAAKCPECSGTYTKKSGPCFSCGRINNAPFNKILKKDLVKISVLVLSVFLIVYMQVPVFALARGPAITVAAASGEQYSTEILPTLPSYNLTSHGRDVVFEETAKEDMALIYYYSSENQSDMETLVTIEIAPATSFMHRWETCLITWPLAHGYQPRVEQMDLKDARIYENPPITSRFFAFKWLATNETQVVLYWFETVIFSINGTSQQKNVKISLIDYPEDPREIPIVESHLLLFAKAIANYWQPIKAWSQIALLLSQRGDELLAITLISTGCVCVFFLFERREERKRNRIVYQKLSRTNRQVIDALHQKERNTMPTLNGVSEAYVKITGTHLDKEKLGEKLSEMEKIGLIKKNVGNKADEPVQIWTINCYF
jgi:exosortase